MRNRKNPELEGELERALLNIYRELGEFGYWANRFYQMFSPHCKRYIGGVATVRRLLIWEPSTGFLKLCKMGRLDQSALPEAVTLHAARPGHTHLIYDS